MSEATYSDPFSRHTLWSPCILSLIFQNNPSFEAVYELGIFWNYRKPCLIAELMLTPRMLENVFLDCICVDFETAIRQSWNHHKNKLRRSWYLTFVGLPPTKQKIYVDDIRKQKENRMWNFWCDDGTRSGLLLLQ